MPNTLEDFLDAADGAGNVLAHARLLLRLANLYQEIAPAHLRQASTIANYKSGIIVIHATSGAVAAKLRQLAPSLADGFSKRGVECNGLQVKVQAHKSETQSRTSTQKPLSTQTSQELTQLRNALPEGSLRDALETLLERSAKAE